MEKAPCVKAKRRADAHYLSAPPISQLPMAAAMATAESAAMATAETVARVWQGLCE